MTNDEAAALLKEMYESAPEGDKVVRAHLFGIRYVREIAGMSCRDLTLLAGLPRHYATEIQKGRRLAEFVVEK